MEWLNDICHRIEGLLSNFAQYIQSNPKVGNLIAIFLLLFWLVGLILNWKWTYKGGTALMDGINYLKLLALILFGFG